jgi:Fe-S-cluster containining protein
VRFGEFIKIERQLTSRDYYCRFGLTNELFLVHIEADYTDSHSPSTKEGELVKGCPFMRKNLTGQGFACAIYATRPRICRELRCYRMVIYNPEGHECGRIMGRDELTTRDELLAQIWKEQIAPLPHNNDARWEKSMNRPLPHNDDARWEKSVIAALAAHGYRGEAVE